MSDTLITIIAIFLVAILMFIFPLMTLADRNDDITQLTIQAETDDLVDGIRKTRRLTFEEYDNFIASIHATGNAYDVEMQFQIIDENPSKKTAQNGNYTVIGENVYYSVFTKQIVDKLEKDGVYILKEGDIVLVTVKNTTPTMAQTLRNFYYKVTGNSTAISTSSAGTVN